MLLYLLPILPACRITLQDIMKLKQPGYSTVLFYELGNIIIQVTLDDQWHEVC